MVDISDFFQEVEEQLLPSYVQEINFLLKDTLSRKCHNYIILNFYR